VIKFTLLSEGSSDRVLLPLLKWLIREHRPAYPIEDQFADLRFLHKPPDNLVDKIVSSIKLYPCHILFVHKDTDRSTYQARKEEIYAAFQQASEQLLEIPQAICVVPKRMQEAWLLFDEQAIRNAAGNPNGTVQLNLPPLQDVESIPDPKLVLHSLLRRSSELHGRRLKDFNPSKQAHRVSEQIDNFEPLRELPAFQNFEMDLLNLLDEFYPLPHSI
jgi:RNAse (barnase) inhibitor barstar